jgi:hypothetical protein
MNAPCDRHTTGMWRAILQFGVTTMLIEVGCVAWYLTQLCSSMVSKPTNYCPACQLSLPFANQKPGVSPPRALTFLPVQHRVRGRIHPLSGRLRRSALACASSSRRSALSGGLRLCRASQETSLASSFVRLLRPRAMSTSADAHLVVLGISFPDAHRARLAPHFFSVSHFPSAKDADAAALACANVLYEQVRTLRAIDQSRAPGSSSSVTPARMMCSTSRFGRTIRRRGMW